MSNEPIPATTISFEVTGANPTTGNCITSNSGNCQFNYLAPNVGTDSITASADVGSEHITNTATVEWLNPPPNDNFANATAIDTLPFDGTASLAASGRESAEPTICGPVEQSVWMKFTPQSDLFAKIEAHGGPNDWVQIAVFDGSTIVTAKPVTCGYINFPQPSNAVPAKVQDPPETYAFAYLNGGTAYHVQIASYRAGDLTIEVSRHFRAIQTATAQMTGVTSWRCSRCTQASQDRSAPALRTSTAPGM